MRSEFYKGLKYNYGSGGKALGLGNIFFLCTNRDDKTIYWKLYDGRKILKTGKSAIKKVNKSCEYFKPRGWFAVFSDNLK